MSRRLACLLLALVATAARAGELDNGLTVFAGTRFGGSFQDTRTDEVVRLRDSSAFSAAFDVGIDAARQLQFFVSRQNSRLPLRPGSPAASLPLRVTIAHVGGTNFFDDPGGAIGSGPYAVGGIGLTRLDPGLDGFSPETRPSLNIGFGWMQPLGSRLALRIEARGYLTLINSSGALFCSGGCTLQVKGDLLQQGEVMIGLTARF